MAETPPNPKAPSDDQKWSVSVMAASGVMSEEQMARALQISPDDLRSTFTFELTVGAQQRLKAIIEGLYRRAMTGDPVAVKTFASLVPKSNAPKGKPVKESAPKQEKAPALGKKEQRKVDAKTAHKGTGWDGVLEHGADKGKNGKQAQKGAH